MQSVSSRGLALGVIAAALIAGCDVSVNGPRQAENEFSLSTSFDGVETLRVRWRNGEIRVRIDDTATELTAAGTKMVTAENPEEASAAMDEFSIVFEVSDSFPSRKTLRFDAPESNLAVMYAADVEVVLPGSVAIDVENKNGMVIVEGNVGLTEIQVDNGQVSVTDQQGDVSVVIENGRALVSSTGGDVLVDVDRGDIDVGADPGTNGLLRARADIGDIDLALPAGSPLNLSLRGEVGGVDASFEGFELSEFSTSPTEVTATLNGGGAEIVGETGAGTVTFGAQ